MTTPHFAAAPMAPMGRPGADDRDPHASVAPLIATVLLVPLGFTALVFGGLSAMATDSCGPDDCSQALTNSLTVIYAMLSYGTLFTIAAYATAWALPWKRRFSAARACAAAASLLPPLLVLLLVFTLPAP